jgi:hypothetical protein
MWSLKCFATAAFVPAVLFSSPGLLRPAMASGGVDDLSRMDDFSNNHGDDDLTKMDDDGNDKDDDFTKMDDYSNYYDGNDGARCSSELNKYYQCLTDHGVKSCDISCAGPAYKEIFAQLTSTFMMGPENNFGPCDSVSSYVCGAFDQACECLNPCLAEIGEYVECHTQNIVGCDIRCASASSFSSARSGESSDISANSTGKTGGGLANQTKDTIPAEEAAGGTSDGGRIASHASVLLIVLFGTVALIGFGLVA